MKYQFRIRACNLAGCSVNVESAEVTIPTTRPAVPSAMAVTVALAE